MADFYRQTAYRARTERRMASKVRCTNCRGYFDRSGIYWQCGGGLTRVCSERCFSEWRDRKRPTKRQVKASRKAARAGKAAASLPVKIRLEVRNRDHHVCRWCGRPGQQVHHIHYRSEGGPDEPSNLILLCTDCHNRAHSSKAAFQPLLLAYIWIVYVEGKHLTIPQVAARLRREGLLSELQEERLAS